MHTRYNAEPSGNEIFLMEEFKTLIIFNTKTSLSAVALPFSLTSDKAMSYGAILPFSSPFPSLHPPSSLLPPLSSLPPPSPSHSRDKTMFYNASKQLTSNLQLLLWKLREEFVLFKHIPEHAYK